MKNTIRHLIVAYFLVVPALADELLNQPFTQENSNAFINKYGLADERVEMLIALMLKRTMETVKLAMETGGQKGMEFDEYIYKDEWTLRDALNQARKDKVMEDVVYKDGRTIRDMIDQARKSQTKETEVLFAEMFPLAATAPCSIRTEVLFAEMFIEVVRYHTLSESAKKKEEERVKREALLSQLRAVASVSILGEKIESQGDDQTQVITIEVVNKSAQEIKGIEGRFLIKDVFGRTFVQLPIRIVNPIAPGQTYTYERKRPFDPADSLTYRVQKKFHDEINSLDFMWEPKAVTYSDGAVVELPDSK